MDDSNGASVNFEVVNGVEGPSFYIDGKRYFGRKPWGGGTIAARWKLSREDAKAILQEALDRLNQKSE